MKELHLLQKGKKAMSYIIAFILGFICIPLISLLIPRKNHKVFQVICVNYEGDTVAVYETSNKNIKVDTFPEGGWKKINYFTTIDGEHVSVATQSGEILIIEKDKWFYEDNR